MLDINHLSFAYPTKKVLFDLNLSIQKGEIFGFLGPNGSGKTTLFKILSTYLAPEEGAVNLNGEDFRRDIQKVRKKIGVVFQSPSLDIKLTVRENLIHQGHLYGLSGEKLQNKIREVMKLFAIEERGNDLAQKLSGGLKRRVELAKGLLHDPEILILDEPSTGLDPGARIDLWRYLKTLNQNYKVTILVTTHLMEEAEHCHRIAILSEGKIVVHGTPNDLKKEIPGEVLVLDVNQQDTPYLVSQLSEIYSKKINGITIRKPGLEDVYLLKTGHKFWDDDK